MNAYVIVSKLLLKITEISFFVSIIKINFFLSIYFYRRIIPRCKKIYILYAVLINEAQLTNYP